MSYQVLARKWRPRTLQTLVGQAPILRILTNALEQKRLHHAYLFTGTRGVGKTTLARILAKCLNCEAGVTAIPCNICKACHDIDKGQFLDLYEIDAASRTKVEDTRDLLDNVPYPPIQGRYKIYLIDEVHMLSHHSFNALLKTLEEPPAHVKFLLATTDPKRLPITILSRCLQFHLKRISSAQIATHLQHICNIENIPSEQAALERLAQAADGSMRDALSLLDQAIAYGNGAISLADISILLGSITQEDLFPLLETLVLREGKKMFDLMTQLAEQAPDFEQLFETLIHCLHRIAIVQIVPSALPAEESISLLAQRFTPEDIQAYYQIALLGRRDIAITPTPQQGFEMTLLRMLAFKPAPTSIDSPLRTFTSSVAIAPPPTTMMAKTVNDTAEMAIDALPTKLPLWRELLPQLDLSGMAYALAANCTLTQFTDTKAELTLSVNHQAMLNSKLKERIAEALSQHFKRSILVDFKMTAMHTDLNTPVKQSLHEQEEKRVQATQIFLQDEQVKKLVEMYDASVEVSLL